jgi:hypothetical protein
VVNVPSLELTFGVFNGHDYSLLVPSIYGLVLNALIFYANVYLIQQLLRQDRRKFTVLSLSYFAGLCLMETLLDSIYFYLFYGYQNGSVLLDILIGSFLMNGMFFYLPSFVYGVLSSLNHSVETVAAKIHIKNGNESVFVSAKELLYVESDSNYCVFQTTTNKYLERRSLASLEEELPQQFVRCHKSFIINTDLIGRQSAKELEIGGRKLPIGRKYKAQLLNRRQ